MIISLSFSFCLSRKHGWLHIIIYSLFAVEIKLIYFDLYFMIFINMVYTYATIVNIVIWLLLIARIETIDYINTFSKWR